MNNKYVVFKREDWDAHRDQPGCMPEDLEVDDAVVIRRQDVFAPPALDAYANLITAALAVAQDVSGHIPGVDEEPGSVKRLREIADYFHEQAALAWDTHRELPD